MSHFILRAKSKERELFGRLMFVAAGILVVCGLGFAAHGIGTASAKSREKILIYTEEELEQYLLDKESEEYNLNGRYQLEADLDLGWLYQSIGTNVEPFTGTFDGNGYVISGLTRPMFGVIRDAHMSRMFFSEVAMEEPFTYYDGEHYVDGYGALSAYVIDSEIVNCGMGGDILAANPRETWFQVEKASPAEAAREDGGEKPGETLELNESEMSEEARGPGVDASETGDGEAGNSQPEAGDINSSGTGSSETESDETENKVTESSEVGSGETDGNETESQEVENSEIEGGETGGGETGILQPESNGGDEAQGEESDRNSSNSETLDNIESNPSEPQTELTPAKGTDSPAPVQSEEMETVAFQRAERQYHMMKLSEVIAEATPADAKEESGITSDLPEMEDSVVSSETEIASPSEADSPHRVGGEGEAVFMAVVADRVIVGGLVAQLAGNTTVTDCFTCVTVTSQTENVDMWTGAFAGSAGTEVRLENSYSSGILDGNDRIGGFVAINHGVILNCYSTTALTMNGSVRGSFVAEGGGRMSGCVYDRQMACADDITGQILGEIWEASSSDGNIMSLEARNTIQMSGIEEKLPGNWYRADKAYPQIEYFALHENPAIADYSRVSAVTLILPDGITLQNVRLGEEPITLTEEMDGQEILWSAEGDIHIDNNHQIVVGSKVEETQEETGKTGEVIEPEPVHEPETVKEPGIVQGPAISMSMNKRNLLTSAIAGQEPAETESQSADDLSGKARLKAVSGIAEKNYSLDINAGALKATPYDDWGKVGEAIYNGTLTGDNYIPAVASDGYYEIETPEALAYFAYLVNNVVGKNAINGRIMKEIDLFGSTHTNIIDTPDPDNMEQGLQWVPIGTASTPYKGNLQGNNHGIKNFVIINDLDEQGFFGYLGDGAIVEGIGIKTGKVVFSGNFNAVVVATIGGSDVKVLRCWNEVDVANINASLALRMGGVVGHFLSGGNLLIEGCWNTGDMTGKVNDVGGILGKFEDSARNLTIQDCYNQGKLDGTQYVGGIIGTESGKGTCIISNCYNTGNITATQSPYQGIVGLQKWDVTNCYYLSGATGGNGATVLSDTQLKSWSAAYALNGESMTGSWKHTEGEYPAIGTPEAASDWEQIGEGIEWNLIKNKKPGSGNGSAATPYQISTPEQLSWFAYKVNSDNSANSGLCADLTGDILSFTGESYGGSTAMPVKWVPIGKYGSTYGGTFGANHANIYELGGLKIDTTADVNASAAQAGLFGTVTGTITKTAVVDSKLTSGGSQAGMIAATLNGGTIYQCYSRGNEADVTSGNIQYLGGIAGLIKGTGAEIRDCYTQETKLSANTSANTRVGGIAGYREDGKIQNCYNACLDSGGITIVNSGTGGSIVGGHSGNDSFLVQCYRDRAFAYEVSEGTKDMNLNTATDSQRQKCTDDLNTYTGLERKGEKRIWYTSLTDEKTKGLPTFDPPAMLTVTVDPAAVKKEGGTLTGSTGIWEGSRPPEGALYRGIHQENSKDTQPACVQVAKSVISDNFNRYGTTSAHQNLALTVGSSDLFLTTSSLTDPASGLTGFDTLTLYNTLAYIYPEERTLLLDLAVKSGVTVTRYEVRIKMKAVTSKSLTVNIATPVYITLEPGVSTTAYTTDQILENVNPYPIKASINGVAAIEAGKEDTAGTTMDVKLTAVSGTRIFDDTEDLAAQGVKLGIAKPDYTADTGNIGDRKLYYEPPADDSGTSQKLVTADIGTGQKFGYRYFIDHSMLHIGPQQKFGFTITYAFIISDKDETGVSVGTE